MIPALTGLEKDMPWAQLTQQPARTYRRKGAPVLRTEQIPAKRNLGVCKGTSSLLLDFSKQQKGDCTHREGEGSAFSQYLSTGRDDLLIFDLCALLTLGKHHGLLSRPSINRIM